MPSRQFVLASNLEIKHGGILVVSHINAKMLPPASQTALRTIRTFQKSSFLARLASTLAILEQREGGLNSASLGAVTAGQKIGGSIHGFVAGKNIKGVAEQAAKVKGLEKIITVENEAYERGLPENYAPLLVENIKKGGYTHVIVGSSAFGKSVLPRVAALLDVQPLTDVMEIQSEDSKWPRCSQYPVCLQLCQPLLDLFMQGTRF